MFRKSSPIWVLLVAAFLKTTNRGVSLKFGSQKSVCSSFFSRRKEIPKLDQCCGFRAGVMFIRKAGQVLSLSIVAFASWPLSAAKRRIYSHTPRSPKTNILFRFLFLFFLLSPISREPESQSER